MKNKGFTLIEVLAVVLLLALLALVIAPKVIEQRDKKTKELNEASKKILFSDAGEYIRNNNYDVISGNVYCISVSTLINEDAISMDAKNFQNDIIKVTIDEDYNFVYSVDNNCKEVNESKNITKIKMLTSIENVSGGYLKEQKLNVVYSKLEGNSYYVKSTRNGISDIDINESCGNSSLPDDCTTITTTKNIEKNVWYKVNGDLIVTYNTDSNVKDVLYAIEKSGTSYTSLARSNIYKIDTTGPVCGDFTGSSTTWTKNDRVISVACSDKGVGCMQDSYSKTFNSSLEKTTVSIEIEDKLGNKTVCSDELDIYVDKSVLSLTPTSTSINKGKTVTIKSTLSNSPTSTVTWSSENEKIATVSSSGVVTGVNSGTTKITAKSTFGLQNSATSTVRVLGTNLVSNPSFESDFTLNDGYNAFVYGRKTKTQLVQEGTLGSSTSSSTNGSYAFHIGSNCTSELYAQSCDTYYYSLAHQTPITPGKVYTISLDYMYAGGFSKASSVFNITDANGNNIKHISLKTGPHKDFTWKRVSTTFTAPENAAYIIPRFGFWSTSYSWMLVDSLQIIEGYSSTYGG